jgi:hypothetical protein
MMQIFRMGSRLLQRTSPWTLLAAGAALAITLPPVRKGLRCAAVVTARGLLTVADSARELTADLREKLEDIAAEARSEEACKLTDDWEDTFETAKTYPRNLAVSAAAAGLAVSEHVGEHAKIAKEHMQGIMTEAKTRRKSRITSPVNNIEATNEHTTEEGV